MLAARLTFSPSQEAADGSGWVVEKGQTDAAPTVTRYATITLALAAISDAFETDPDVDAYLQQAAEDSVLTTNAAAVVSAKAALRTAEGL